jgi:hypothetical protein
MPGPLALLPYIAAAYGGYQGYRGARDSGASGLGRILGGLTGAYTGYNLGAMAPGAVPYSQLGQNFASLKGLPGQVAGIPQTFTGSTTLPGQSGGFIPTPPAEAARGSILDILKRQKADGTGMEFSPGKVSAAIAAGTYLSGAFDPQPTDIYTPGYNMGYLNLQDNRTGYTFIDPITGEEKAYEKVYAPEQAGKGSPRMGNYQMNVQRFNTGGISQIKKFNEGGINYLPSKMTHDENDSNNYARASGYVEDGSGNGDKDEDTMLAQLADGEFVTRADGVLGAGIIAGANPNSMKDMREKGAKYFYEQQAKYKRVFDLLKEKNGDSKQKTN